MNILTEYDVSIIAGGVDQRIGPAGAIVGAAVGAAAHQGIHLATHGTLAPIKTTLAAAGVGALTGLTGGALVAASGGGLAGNLAWRPGMAALNFGANKASQFYLNGH